MLNGAEKVFGGLRSLLSEPSALFTDLSEHQDYFHDATEFSAAPLAVVMAACRDDVVAAVTFCGERSIPITARGAGTGLSGGCVPSEGGLVLSTERINHLRIDADKTTAVCGPGVITKAVLDAAGAHGLIYPPDPASYEESTIGGNVAENAGGLRCKRFGVTKDYVLGLEAVLADGSVLKTGVFNDFRGFSLGDILIGSEGTLAVITEIALRLVASPADGDTILVSFSDPGDAARTVSDLTAAGIVPTVLEFLDGDAAACSNEYEHTDGLDDAAAILLIETSDGTGGAQARSIRDFCHQHDCTYFRLESDRASAESLWKVRRNLSNATKELAGYRVSEDVAVPNQKFPELVQFVAQLNRETELRINSFGHAGDGNLHVNFMAANGAREQLAHIETAANRLIDKTLDLGGTLTGEHGIGLAKKRFLSKEFDRPTMDILLKIKAVFDPLDLLNPGKIFPDRQ